ncbi:MAG: hypothetical protein H6835_18250 [Planctomycetes bacterium]|nr:hypothetical protein [Planctomycetota bacterium]
MTRDKVVMPGPTSPSGCSSFGGTWYNGQCYMLLHPGLTTRTACETNGGLWDPTGNLCYFGSCKWAWL